MVSTSFPGIAGDFRLIGARLREIEGRPPAASADTPDAELLACCAALAEAQAESDEANRRMDAPEISPAEEKAIWDEADMGCWQRLDDALDRLVGLRAGTREGLRAKAAATKVQLSRRWADIDSPDTIERQLVLSILADLLAPDSAGAPNPSAES